MVWSEGTPSDFAAIIPLQTAALGAGTLHYHARRERGVGGTPGLNLTPGIFQRNGSLNSDTRMEVNRRSRRGEEVGELNGRSSDCVQGVEQLAGEEHEWVVGS